MASKPLYTFEVATNAPKGQWKVADRVFYDRRLTLKEKAAAIQGGSDLGFLALALSALKIEGEDVAASWIEEYLSEDDLKTAIRFVLGGAEAVEKAVNGSA